MSEIVPADPYLTCVKCRAWVTHWTNTGDGEGPQVNQPCGHAADYHHECPSWSPVDGCGCFEHFGYVPHDQSPKASR